MDMLLLEFMAMDMTILMILVDMARQVVLSVRQVEEY